MAAKGLTMANHARQLPEHLAYINGLNTHISHNLSNSCAQSLTVSELLTLTEKNCDDLQLSYAPMRGDVKLRQEIAHFHRQLNESLHSKTQDLNTCNEHNVLTFCGAQEALAAVYESVLKPGDEVVVLTPCYPSLVTMAENLGAKVRKVELSEQIGWPIEYQALEAVVNEKTKLIITNSPHNPTGSVIDSALSLKILALAQRYQCYLVADDVSQASNYHNLELAHDYLSYHNTVVISVMSKSFGLAGLRVGWAISQNTQLLDKMLAVKSYGSICCSAIDERLATYALQNADKILAKNNKTITENIALFNDFVEKNSEKLKWCPPKAGMLAVVKSRLSTPTKIWTQALVRQKGVLLLPTSLFGLNGEYVRLGLGQQNFAEGLALWQSFLDENVL